MKMPKVKTSDIFSDYVRVKKPDKQKLAELADRAKGGRSVNQFARECGVNPSTISRLINAEGTKPNSDDLIAAVAANADPDSSVTLEDMLDAHGLMRLDIPVNSLKDSDIQKGKKVVDQILEKYGDMPASGKADVKRKMAVMYKESELENAAREAVQNELLLRGYSLEPLQFTTQSMKQFGDFGYKTNAVSELGLDEWIFDVKSNIRINVTGQGKRFLSYAFALAYMKSPKDRKQKISFVVDHPTLFNQLVDMCKGIKIYDVFSVILIDRGIRKVIKEFQIPCKGMELPESVFERGEKR